MAIIVGDIHGDLPMTRAFLAFKPEAEHVSLGDIVDSRNPITPFNEELACLDLLLDSDTIIAWGNHDLAYTTERPWGGFTRHGFINDTEVPCWTEGNKYLARVFENNGALYYKDIFECRYEIARQKGQIKAAHAVDGWLCTHAGVSAALTAALPSAPWDSGDTSAIASWICEEFEREFAEKRRPWHESIESFGKGPLFYTDWTRGGENAYGGIFWYDPQLESQHPPDPRFRQIFGHTKVEGPMRKDNHVNIHIEDGWWVFDTESEGFVRLRP